MSRNLETRIEIGTPVETVWRILTDTEALPEWSVDLRFGEPLREGQVVPMTIRLFGVSLTVRIFVEALEASRELRWRGGPRGLFVGSHYLRLSPRGVGKTELRHGEDFSGLAVPLLFPLLRRELQAFYLRINEALKMRAESTA